MKRCVIKLNRFYDTVHTYRSPNSNELVAVDDVAKYMKHCDGGFHAYTTGLGIWRRPICSIDAGEGYIGRVVFSDGSLFWDAHLLDYLPRLSHIPRPLYERVNDLDAGKADIPHITFDNVDEHDLGVPDSFDYFLSIYDKEPMEVFVLMYDICIHEFYWLITETNPQLGARLYYPA